MKVALTVNGKRRSVEADGDTPLLWVIRDLLGLTGTKYGCGIGACGACTVLEGSRAIRSCQITLEDAAGRSFTTIEALSDDASHPVQRAWIDHDVSQCGYCQAGMILEVAALLEREAKPSSDELYRALSSHVCRCGSHPRIRNAIESLSGRGETDD